MAKKKKQSKKQSEISVFESTIDNFTYNVDCLSFSIPIIMGPLVKKYKTSKEAFDNFLSKKAIKKSGNKYSIKLEDTHQFETLDKKLRNSYFAIRTVPRSLFISLISFFDNHLKELLKIVFDKNPNLLNSTEKKISVSEILDIKNFSEAKTYLINRETEQLLYEGRFKCLEWLENKLNIKFNLDPPLKKEFIEISERRNLFVHSDGVITKQYLNTCKKNGILLDKKLRVGHKLSLSPRYFSRSCLVILSLGVEFGQALWRKLEPENLRNADISLLNMTAALIDDGNNFVAGRLLDFANQFQKFSSEELKLMLMVNQALAMKFGGAQDKANELINSHDWSDAKNEFKLAVAIIKNDLKKAAKIMLDIGPTGEMKMAYKKDWPLFKEFRKSPLFRKTYKQIFKESFFIRDKKVEDSDVLETHQESSVKLS